MGVQKQAMCVDKYCQDPKTPCPTDNFVICVKENTKVSTLLQWNALLQNFDASMGVQKPALLQDASAADSCQAQDLNLRVQVFARLVALGPQCEDMCKKMGIYPNCQCGGFEGAVASAGDQRMCIDKYCQDPKTPCPTDNFVTCVKANTKVSTLQWSALFQRFESFISERKRWLALPTFG